jgi:hypothetical protein
MKKIIIALLVVLLLGFLGFYGVSSMNYSDGNRAGYLIKISRKGVLFKTYEGQLNLGGTQSGDVTAIVGNQMWEFSVANKEVYEELTKYEGKKVSLHYKQKMRSFWWQGDTDYFVDKVEALD